MRRFAALSASWGAGGLIVVAVDGVAVHDFGILIPEIWKNMSRAW
jgi:hypothetical protein